MLPIIERGPNSVFFFSAALVRHVADAQRVDQKFNRRCMSDACSSFRLRSVDLLGGAVKSTIQAVSTAVLDL